MNHPKAFAEYARVLIWTTLSLVLVNLLLLADFVASTEGRAVLSPVFVFGVVFGVLIPLFATAKSQRLLRSDLQQTN
jgi:hypothetical protein